MSKDNNLKIMIVSSKGGVGKSTVSMQLIAPYLYDKSNEVVSFYEFDDENNDSLSYGASQLTKREIVEVHSNILRERLMDICTIDENACLDIGGNKTTTMVLDALNDTGMVHYIDLAVIPLLEGEQDAINASVTYATLKSMNPELTVIFALNRAKNHRYINYQFDNFFGDVRGILNDDTSVKNYLFDGDIDNYIVLLDDDIIKHSRRFGLTIYEISKMHRDYTSYIKVSKQEFSKEQEIKLASFKNYVQKSSKDYYENVLEPAFNKIDHILETKNDNKAT